MDSEQDTQDFLRIVGHSITSPLINILELVDMLTYGIEGEISQSTRETAHKVRDLAEQVLDLNESVLALVSVESVREAPSAVEISDPIHRAYNNVMTLANARHQQVILNLPARLPLVKASSSTLYQALRVLFTNAFGLAQNDTISISATVIETFVIVSIQGGESLNAQQSLSIVDLLRFHAIAELGLDLLLCRRIAQIAGGDLWLTGDLERGDIGWHISWPIVDGSQR